MELNEIKELMGILKDTDITELQVERDGAKLKIRRDKFFGHIEMPHASLEIKKQEIPQDILMEDIEPEPKLLTVCSPIVGTFYRASTPEATPLVDVGSSIKKGQILCIIEAMKLMNEIESEFDGVISKILVGSGSAVEYGEPLFLIDPSK